MRVLITGIAGFIGSRFAKYLLDTFSDIEIIGVDNLSGGFIENVPKDDRLIFVNGDLTNKDDQQVLESIIKNGELDYIYHYSAIAAEGLSPFIRQYNYKNNVVASMFVINCGIKYRIKRFIFTSSMAVYGNQNPPFDEDLIPNPIDSYGIAKYCIEMDLKVAYEQHNMEYVIIRPHNVVGHGQNIFDPYRNVIGIWMYQALTHKSFTIYGDGNQTRAFSVIDDILPCLYNASIKIEAKNQIINVGGIKEISLNDVSLILLQITGNKKPIIYLEQRHEVIHAWSTFQKSIDLLDYKQTISLEDGIKTMWEYVKTQPIKERKYFSEYELDTGIYSYWKRT